MPVMMITTLTFNLSKPIGMTGFEPATLCSQSRCATKLRYIPSFLT